jgi:hypothetical protein
MSLQDGFVWQMNKYLNNEFLLDVIIFVQELRFKAIMDEERHQHRASTRGR